SGEKRVFLVILFTSFSGSLVSRIPGAVQSTELLRPIILAVELDPPHQVASYQNHKSFWI
ncbi:hypothetical protein, partial [Escherichia albertii]|uniref:hypothetical protein n=1 Tax=Escherichia albertii TaxID=208962 RepID=UPI003F740525